MLRRDIADKLYAIVVHRFFDECIDRTLTSQELVRIWYAIYGRLCRGESEAEVKEWCMKVPLN